MKQRTTEIKRETKETKIDLRLSLDGVGNAEIVTGIGFLDHMLTALVHHSRFDAVLKCKGDLQVDDHHTAEDCALALGSAIDRCLEDRRGITRFGYAYAPLDEALARAVIDFSGRPSANISLGLTREKLGDLASENIHHVFVSLAQTARASIHIDLIRGENDHHRAEAAFKALALALRQAVTPTGSKDIPSTKGVL